MEYLKTLMEERETIAATVEAYATKATERGSDLTDAETTEVKRLQERAVAIDDRLSTFAGAQESSRAYADLAGRLGKTREERQTVERETTEHKSAGETFTASEEFRGYGGHGRSGVVTVDDLWEFRAPPIMLADLPAIPRGQRFVPTLPDAYPLFGLINTETVSTNAFDFVLETFTDNSAVVAEGAAKPESDYVQTLVPGVLDTIAHFVTISRQALEDDGRVRSIIDGKLTNGVLKKQHASVAAALVAATLPTASATGNLLAAIRVGVGTVEAAGYNPNAVLLNPADYAALDVAVLNETRNGPVVGQSFWGLRPVAFNAQPAGVATVGDFQDGATLFRRSGVQVYATDSHASQFTSNLITILGEARSKAVVTATAAFCECSAA